MLGLITGSGFYALHGLDEPRERRIVTPFGEVTVTEGSWKGGSSVLFLPRHGADHSVPPHAINYRANIWALHEAGASGVVATAVSGGIAPGLDPGTFVLIDDFIDFTDGRPRTFFHEPGNVQHTEMGDPYDAGLRALISEAASAVRVPMVEGGTYCATNGPRFETKAEIEMMRRLGGDLVGMTGCPEVVLARELELPYAAIGVISNRAAGLSEHEFTVPEIMDILVSAGFPLELVLGEVIERYAP